MGLISAVVAAAVGTAAWLTLAPLPLPFGESVKPGLVVASTTVALFLLPF